jgi:hypothetical protein
MVTKKLIIEFNENPIVGSSFYYELFVNNGEVLYPTTGNALVYLEYVSGPGSLIGTDIADTITKTITALNTFYSFSGFVNSYSVSISYVAVGNTIEVIVTSSAPSENIITFWKILTNDNKINLTSSTPCIKAYLSSTSIVNYVDIFTGVPSGNYILENVELGTSSVIEIPSNFDTLLARGYHYKILDFTTGAFIEQFEIYQSVTSANVNAYISSNDLFINIVGLPFGYDANNYRFSLDGITYQTSNTFTGLSIGSHTFYIKDSIGCVQSFTIANNGTTNTNNVTKYNHISESNSLRIVKSVDQQNCGNYKNIYNTLSCQENTQIANKYIQLFQTCDTEIKTQMLSSYENIEVYTYDELGTQTQITPVKIVNNIGLEDKRDCTYYSYNNRLAVIFTSGNIYNYGTTTIIDTYILNGTLPAYGIVGNWVETPYGTLQIVDIRLADNGERSLILNLNITLSGTIAGTIQTIYNRENYNVWEFTIDMSNYENKKFIVAIETFQTIPDILFPNEYFVSETIHVKQRHHRSKEVIWYNSKNTDIYYFSGIQMKNRINFLDVNTRLSDGSVENEKTDSEVISIDATNYKSCELEILFLTTGMIDKILLALKHDNLIIENVPYKLTENPEINRNGKSNFYTLKAKLTEAGDVWNQGTANTQVVYGNVNLIGLLQGDANAEYIRIQ